MSKEHPADHSAKIKRVNRTEGQVAGIRKMIGDRRYCMDILAQTRAAATGNSFAFLMTGVATDYTEIMSLKDNTGSWKIALFLPLVTVPQVLVVSWIMNGMG